MKKLLILLTAMITAIIANAQSAQIATLSHDGTITTYYSSDALKQAYEAAVEGDIITLSSGTFSAPAKIEKNLTIRGAGMMPDDNPTVLTGNMSIQTPESDTFHTSIEGVYTASRWVLSSKEVRLIKVWVKSLNPYGVKNLSIIQSKIEYYSASNGYTSFSIFNSIIGSSGFEYTNLGYIENSLIYATTSAFALSADNIFYKNCIFTNTRGSVSSTIPSSCTVSHCYFIGDQTNPFKNIINTSNVLKNKTAESDVFKDNIFYELKDELKEEWLGEDGTQVGAFGGAMPFDPTPTNPQITKFQVAPKTTADGKLSVDIEVKAN